VTEKYTIENGLPSSRVTAIFVDEEDAWVGTADAGIARYNFQEGNWFVTKAEDGLASNRVSDVTKYKGRVFVATQDGISVWDGAAWTTMDSAVDGKVKLFNAVMRVQEGLLWVAARTMYGGLLSFDGDKWKDRSTIKAGTLLNNVTDFTFSGNTLWIGTTNRGLFRFDGKDWATFTVTEGLASNFVYTLGVSGDNCYVGGCCGLSALEDGSWKIYDIAEGMPHSTIRRTSGTTWLPPSSFTAVAPPSCNSRPAFRTASSGFAW
jgi:ligand-binding sensor domain-containing protein